MTEGTCRIVRAIRAVPPGRVSCYRDIALAAGFPNGARQVVRVLHTLTDKEKLPWHRIIRADGFIALPREEGGLLQARLLRAEGVRVSRRAGPKPSPSGLWVDLKRYGFFSE
ncbi:MAG: MGMT family protein [Treponema sp.]|jgi:methylated-DNA-protein-cysteine methyltransferase-like protein|nr:MGMT family protein [Treponema sp.]